MSSRHHSWGTSCRTTVRRVLALACCWLFTATLGHTQPKPKPNDNPTATQISEAIEQLDAGKLLDGIEQLQRVMDTAGDELVPSEQHRHLPARWVVQRLISQLPPAGLNIYRQRIDGQATKRVENAIKAPTNRELKRLLTDMFNCTATERAIIELARRAHERGDLAEAAHYWKMLLPTPTPDDGELHFPKPQIPVAVVRARLIHLAMIQGDDTASAQVAKFRNDFPDATGLLAGQQGKLVDTLTELDRKRERVQLPADLPTVGWNTFAGKATRDGNQATLPYWWPDVPTWKKPLPCIQHARFSEAAGNPFSREALAFYPLITEDEILLADQSELWSIDPKTGKATTVYHDADATRTVIPTVHDVRFTLEHHSDTLYARFGATALQPPVGEEAVPKSSIVAFGPRTGKNPKRAVLWKLPPPTAIESTTIWEGCPVVQNDAMFAQFWRQAAGEMVTGLACYQLPIHGGEPRLRWQRIIGKSGTEPNGQTRYRHELVTVSAQRVIAQTQAGSVIALHRVTGLPVWEFRYVSDQRPTLPRYRDLCPPVVANGQVYLAPADCDRLFAVDEFSGRLLWEREGLEVTHLFGVAQGKLIASIGGSLKGLRGFNSRTGGDSGSEGWTLHDQTGEITFGRGLLSHDVVIWPTRNGLWFIDPRDGRPRRQPLPGSFGNCAYAHQRLIVTTGTEMWCFTQEDRPQSKLPLPADLPPDAMLWDHLNRPIRAAQLREVPPIPTNNSDSPATRMIETPVHADGPRERRLIREINDSSLRIVGASGRIRAIGERLHLGEQSFPNPAKHPVNFIGELPNVIILGGPTGITAIHPSRATVLWELQIKTDAPHLPGPDRLLPILLASGHEPTTRFDAITVNAAGVFAIHQGRELICYDPSTGLLKWSKRPHEMGRRIPFAAKINPAIGYNGDELAIQTSSGDAAVLDARTGERIAEPKTTGSQWETPPHALGRGQFLWPIDDGLIVLEAKRAKPNPHRYRLQQTVTLSGKPPRVLEHGQSLLVLIERNVGTEVDLLDRTTLERRWKGDPLFLGYQLEDVALYDDRLIAIADDRCIAYSVTTGELKWNRPLASSPVERWLRLAAAQVWVVPRHVSPLRSKPEVPPALRLAGLDISQLLQPAIDSYDVGTMPEWSICLHNMADGELFQRWTFPTNGPAAAFQLFGDQAHIITGHGCWRLVPFVER